MNIWHDIDEKRIAAIDFISVIEISKGSNMKYELDKDTGFLMLDRVLYTATHVKREGEPTGFRVQITWDHAPGAAWEAYAKEMGWLQEMNLQVQICEGDDIIY